MATLTTDQIEERIREIMATAPDGTDPDFLRTILKFKEEKMRETSLKAFLDSKITRRRDDGAESLPSRSRNGVEKLDTVDFRRPPPAYDEAELEEVPADSPLVTLLDVDTCLSEFGDFLFRMNKTRQHADQSRGVLEALVKAGWTSQEFRNALGYFESVTEDLDADLLKELRYTTAIVTIHFNQVRSRLPVAAGRLHVVQHASRIARTNQVALERIFNPVRIAGRPGVLYFLHNINP